MRRLPRSPVLLCLALALRLATPVSEMVSQTVAQAAQQPWALRGTVVTPSGPIADATVLIDGSSILAVGRDLALPAGTRVVTTDGVIYPGLIDLHNHVTWNALPRWSSGAKSGARYDWQQLPEYQMALGAPHQKMVAEGHGCAAERYAEVKAIVGGATAQAGLNPDDLTVPVSVSGAASGPAAIPPDCLGGWVRELGVSSRLFPKGAQEPLRYEVFPLALDPANTQAILDGLHRGAILSALFHIAEGDATNASARREFGMLKARGLLVPGVSIIHGVALSPANFAEMAKAHVGLVWSPRSNFELYGQTANLDAAFREGVTVSLAPDWSPTGSDNMWEEIQYAWNVSSQDLDGLYSSRQLIEMASSVPARVAWIDDKVGTLAPGMYADFFLVQDTPDGPASDFYDAILVKPIADIDLVVIDGIPVYGDPAMLKSLSIPTEPLKLCGKEKALNSTALPNGPFAQVEARLSAKMKALGSELGPLDSCPQP